MGLLETIRRLVGFFWGQPDWIGIIATVAAFLVYLNTLKAGFVYDDSRAILTNPDIRPETPWSNLLQNDFWGTPLQNSGSHKSFRPLTTLSFRLNFLLSGLNPWPYHLTNVLLHTLTTWLFVRVARLVFCSKSCLYLSTLCHVSSNNGPSASQHLSPSTRFFSSGGGSCQRRGRLMEVTTSSRNLAVLLSSLLFALHPIHTEAVAGLVGRADVGSTAFALLSFISYVRFVKFRDKARRISSALITPKRSHQLNNSPRNNGSRSHSPLCPNKSKKAVNNHYHNSYQARQQPHHEYQQYLQTSAGSMGTGLCTRFTNILTSFSSFLLMRMKMFAVVVNQEEDDKSAGMVTTTKGSNDSVLLTSAGSNGYQKVKGSACDRSSPTANGGGDYSVSGSGCSSVAGGGVVASDSTVISWFWWSVWFIAAIGFAAAAMLTKEQGITILLVCAAYDLVRSLVRSRHLYQERPSLLRLECGWSLILLGMSSLGLLYLRLRLMGPNFAAPVFSKADNSIAHQSSFWVRLGTFLFLPVLNFGLIIFPYPLSYDWSMDAIRPIQSFWELRNIISLAFYCILIRRVYSLVRRVSESSKETGVASVAPTITGHQQLFLTHKRAATNGRSRRDFLLLNGHSSHNGSGNSAAPISGNYSSQWWPWSSTWSCYSPSASSSSITSSGYSGSMFPSSISTDDVTLPSSSSPAAVPAYPYNIGNGPNRKDYCNVCHLWMSTGRKNHQHNNNNSIWNEEPPPSPDYFNLFEGKEHEADCDDTSSNGSSCSSRSSSSSNGSSLISNGHQGRSNHYRSSGNSPPAAQHHHQHQNFRYRVTSSGGGSSGNISNGFGNGGNANITTTSYNNIPAPTPHYGNGIISSSTSSFTTISSGAGEGEYVLENTAISRSSEASSALQCASLLVQLSFLVLPFLPATNLFFYVGFVVAERVLYMPSVGFCLLLGHGFLHVWNRLQCHHHHHHHHHHHNQQKHYHYQKQRHHSSRGQGHHHHHHRYNKSSFSPSIPSASLGNSCNHISTTASIRKQKRLRKLLVLAVITSLLVLTLRTVRRNEDWEDEGKLYKSGILVNPPKSLGNLGIVLSNQGKLEEAEQAYRKALHFRSNLADVHYNLGILLETQGRLDEALESYRSAIHFRPKLAPAYVNAGQVLTRLGKIGDAREMYTNCLGISDEGIKDLRNHLEAKTSAYLRLGKLLVEDENDPRAAIGIYRQAVKLMPADYSQKQAVYNSLGEALYRNGQAEEAEQWFLKALQTKPDHVPAHITYGKMLARNKTRVLEAESWFRRAKKIAPADSSVYHHYGQFLSVQGRHSEAAESYVTAANLDPNDYDIIVGAANALRLSGDNAQAELYYKKAVGIRPQEARAHMNYGAMLHVNGKYTEATKSYLTALRLKPEDDVTLMNLKKVMAISKSSKSLVLISCQHNKNLL